MPERIKFFIKPSDSKNKKFDAVFIRGNEYMIVSFGSKPYQDFTQHHDENRRRLYLLRHRSRENWETPFTAGSLSRWVLWGDHKNINDNIKAFKKRFNLY